MKVFIVSLLSTSLDTDNSSMEIRCEELSIVEHTCTLSTQEAEAEGSQVLGRHCDTLSKKKTKQHRVVLCACCVNVYVCAHVCVCVCKLVSPAERTGEIIKALKFILFIKIMTQKVDKRAKVEFQKEMESLKLEQSLRILPQLKKDSRVVLYKLNELAYQCGCCRTIEHGPDEGHGGEKSGNGNVFV